jgi:alkylation response protein AidB-like acyl-CoA dehydrogenase
MDFNLSEEQASIRDLAREILEKEIDADRLKEVERSDAWFDRELWSKLAEANLLGLVVPEEHGGMGFGIEELCVLLEELGRVLAPVPLHATATAALALVRSGTPAQQAAWLPGVAAGERVLATALDDAGSTEPDAPATRATRAGDVFLLSGTKRFVSAAHLAERILVPAATDDGVGLFWVAPEAAGVTCTARRTSTGEPLFDLVLDDVRVAAGDVLGGDPQGGAQTARWLQELSTIGLCALQIGVSDKALAITTGYVSEREQFGGPIGAFQAVQHRCADGYIDLESIRWTTWRAASRLARGLPVRREAAVAKFWAADGGSRIAGSAQHLHGGIGVDVDYPIHRYFLWTKALEFRLGGATPTLVRLGRDMAAHPPAGKTSEENA